MDIEVWLSEVATSGHVWYLKRLSANDTQQSGSHQAGPYVPKNLMFALFPALDRADVPNPDHRFRLTVDSSPTRSDVQARAVWYNNKLRDNPTRGRDEVRITRLGGTASPLLDKENTGALALFAFRRTSPEHSAHHCRVWICQGIEDDIVESRWGPVEPGELRLVDFDGGSLLSTQQHPCWLQRDDIPETWLADYPSGEEIIKKVVTLRPLGGDDVDERLMERRACEFAVFQSLEEALELPTIRQGFQDLPSFLQRANTILQRRKSRAGRSLELHTKTILEEEALEEGRGFSYQTTSEANKRPDFLFPNGQAYADPNFPNNQLRMLAVKTTCRDRWRQILNEADRIETKHLLTLQEGISPRQYQEMTSAGVQLVVPKRVQRSYRNDMHVLSLDAFIREVRGLG